MLVLGTEDLTSTLFKIGLIISQDSGNTDACENTSFLFYSETVLALFCIFSTLLKILSSFRLVSQELPKIICYLYCFNAVCLTHISIYMRTSNPTEMGIVSVNLDRSRYTTLRLICRFVIFLE